ncbi:ABC transporter permease [Blattabacterium cuenoti]|uniref:ABC transporter permease n=1 Tax=Blattabacterium cuenoti TaxID=1653831 RepID=UPI00163B7825|nr:ABC transporter permease [Blattabacterium cuenoti]
MKTSFYISIRYFFSKKKTNIVNIILFLSTLSLTISTLTLSIILSVFSGLKDLNVKFYKTHYPDITISSNSNEKEIHVNDNILLKKIKDTKGILAFSKTMEKKVYFHYKDDVYLFYLKGVDSEYQKVMNIFQKIIINKNTKNDKMNIYVSLFFPIIHYLSFLPVKIKFFYFFKKNKHLVPFFIEKKAKIKGFFKFNQQTDHKYLFCDLYEIQNLIKRNVFQTLEIKISKNENVEQIKRILKKKLGSQFLIKTRIEEEKAFYKVINTEKIFIYFLFSLIALITGFNLMSAIYILQIDKKNQLFVLWSFGYSLYDIKKIFFYIGILITFFGWVTGIFVSYIVFFLQKTYHIFMIVEKIPFPLKFTIEDFFLITPVIFFVGIIVSFLSYRKRYF